MFQPLGIHDCRKSMQLMVGFFFEVLGDPYTWGRNGGISPDSTVWVCTFARVCSQTYAIFNQEIISTASMLALPSIVQKSHLWLHPVHANLRTSDEVETLDRLLCTCVSKIIINVCLSKIL